MTRRGRSGARDRGGIPWQHVERQSRPRKAVGARRACVRTTLEPRHTVTCSSRKFFNLNFCLPTAPELPVLANGCYGTQPFFWQLLLVWRLPFVRIGGRWHTKHCRSSFWSFRNRAICYRGRSRRQRGAAATQYQHALPWQQALFKIAQLDSRTSAPFYGPAKQHGGAPHR
jgi:hypothetical protein